MLRVVSCLKQVVGFVEVMGNGVRVEPGDGVINSRHCVHSSSLSLGSAVFLFLCHAYSLGQVDGGVKSPVCDVRHILPLCKSMVHSAIFAAADSGVSTVRSTAIGMNLDISPATNTFVRNFRYASVTARGS